MSSIYIFMKIKIHWHTNHEIPGTTERISRPTASTKVKDAHWRNCFEKLSQARGLGPCKTCFISFTGFFRILYYTGLVYFHGYPFQLCTVGIPVCQVELGWWCWRFRECEATGRVVDWLVREAKKFKKSTGSNVQSVAGLAVLV